MQKQSGKKTPLSKKARVAVIAMGAVDLLLVAGIVLVVIFGGTSPAAAVEPAVSSGFTANQDTYGEDTQLYTASGTVQAGNAASASSAPSQASSSAASQPVSSAASQPASTAAGGKAFPAADFIFPDSDKVLITPADMAQKVTDAAKCQRAINEIYARYGFQFNVDTNQVEYNYFNSKSWYKDLPKIESQDAVVARFNSIEKLNVDMLAAYRQSKNW